MAETAQVQSLAQCHLTEDFQILVVKSWNQTTKNFAREVYCPLNLLLLNKVFMYFDIPSVASMILK